MSFTQEFNLLLKARYPIIYVTTIEEDRLEYTIRNCIPVTWTRRTCRPMQEDDPVMFE